MNLNIRTSRYFTVFLMILLAACGSTPKKVNTYNLKVISEVDEYNKRVADDPELALIDIEKVIPGIVLDIRYATKNNFTGRKLYDSPKAFIRKPVAELLLQIQNELKEKGIGLKIYDAYRPYYVTVKFYEIYPDTTFVAPPWRGSVHNTGCAVDLTLIDLQTGEELAMPTPFDDFSEKAAHSYQDLPQNVLNNRQLLKDVMLRHGFEIYPAEWWHYDYNNWDKFEFVNLSFEELEK